MKILHDKFRGEYLRHVWSGETITRLQNNKGQTRILKNQEFEKLKLQNGVYQNDSPLLAQLAVDFGGVN